MTDDKILFLSFLFISDYFKTDFIKTEYEELVPNIQKNAWEFDRIVNWFKDDKITVDMHISFSHPSYSEALKYILINKDKSLSKINKDIFSKLLFKLAENDEAAGGVAWGVANNFDKLPENVRNLLDKLQEHLHNVIENLSESEKWNKIEAIKLISKARTKIDKTFALKILDKLSKDENKKVRTKAVKLINIIQKELKIDEKY